MSLHAAAAGLLKTPELAIDENEAKTFAKALVDLEAAFPTQIDPRMLAVVNFAGVAAMIYGPRIFAIRMRADIERKARRASALPEPTAETGFTMPDFGGQQFN